MSQERTTSLLLWHLDRNLSQEYLSPDLPHLSSNTTKALHSAAVWTSMAACLALVAVVGAAGNSLVLLTAVRMPQLHRLTYVLIASLSVDGLLVSVVSIPLHLLHLLTGGAPAWLEGRAMPCKVQAYVNLALTLTYLTNTVTIAVCRYRSIVETRNVRFHVDNRKKTWQVVALLWGLPLLLSVSAAPFLGFSDLMLDCYFLDTRESVWYTGVVVTFPALSTMLCVFISYALILKKVRDSRLKVMNFHINHHKGSLRASSTSDMKMNSESDKGESSQTSFQAAPAVLVSVLKNAGSEDASNRLGVPSTSTASPPGLMRFAAIPSVVPLEIPSINLTQAEMSQVHCDSSKKDDFSLSVPQLVSWTSAAPLRSQRPQGGNCTANSQATSKQFKREVRLTFHLYLAFAMFCLLYLPSCFIHLVHAVKVQSADTWLLLHTMSTSLSSSTWILYGFLNRDFRKACKAFLACKRNL